MTTEEKAKRYDETLEQLKGLIEGTREDRCAIVEEDIIDIFPELKESEDERIRKELIAEVKYQIEYIPAPDCRDKEDEKTLKQLNSWLAWLEKQGEQKPK